MHIRWMSHMACRTLTLGKWLMEFHFFVIQQRARGGKNGPFSVPRLLVVTFQTQFRLGLLEMRGMLGAVWMMTLHALPLGHGPVQGGSPEFFFIMAWKTKSCAFSPDFEIVRSLFRRQMTKDAQPVHRGRFMDVTVFLYI